MIQEFIDYWRKDKQNFQNWLEGLDKEELEWKLEYSDIVKHIFAEVINPNIKYENHYYDGFEVDKMTVIDDGDYQGTNIFIIPKDVYQPSVEDYVYTHNYYGSCSGCDALQHAQTLDRDKCIESIMTIALHLVSNMKWLSDQ